MFKANDECQIPVPYEDKCARGRTECLGKKCSDYILPQHLIDYNYKINELAGWEAKYKELGAKIAARRIEMKLDVKPEVTPVDEPKDVEPEVIKRRGRPAK